MKILIRVFYAMVQDPEKRREKRKIALRRYEKTFNRISLLVKSFLKTFLFCENRFDLIISLGDRCQISQQMRKNYFQIRTYPFDWLRNGSLKSILNCFETEFKFFLKRENLVFLEKKEHSLLVYDKYTSFEFLHDFYGDKIDDDYHKVYAKYQRRIKRLYSHINKSKNICFIWRCDDSNVEDVKKIYAFFESKYPYKKLTIFILKNKENQEQIIINNLFKNVYEVFFDLDTYYGRWETGRWEGNDILYKKFFDKISLTFLGYIKEFFHD